MNQLSEAENAKVTDRTLTEVDIDGRTPTWDLVAAHVREIERHRAL